MPKKVRNLEVSSGAFSTTTVAGVVAREASAELVADGTGEGLTATPGAAGAVSAMRMESTRRAGAAA
jgi:hypothetical protein